MKGLLNFPSKKDLSLAYDLLQFKKNKVGEDKIALFSQWSRLDPRLAEIWVLFISKNWKTLNALKLNKFLQQESWPNSAGVLLEFAKKAVLSEEKKLFSHWAEMALHRIQKNTWWSQFFWGGRAFGGTLMFDDARLSSEEYRKWGYLGRESLFNKNKSVLKYSPQVRLEILKTLFHEKNKITVRDYWNAIGKCISLRQAERDLKSWSFLHPEGNTKGRRFTI